ncbi:T9SS type A sorting domain-containing protein [Balamuthia mandrillaris]
MTWVDVDQDGLLDVFFLGTHRPMFTEASLLFHNDGNWTFSEITHQAFSDSSLPRDLPGQARWADFNQDGFPDLLVFSSESHTEKFVKVWKNNRGANFTEVTTELLPALSVCQSSWCWLEWGDFDGDDLVDLFLSVRNDAKTVFLNDGNEPTTFTTEVDVTSAFGGAYHAYVGEVRVVDFDGDGDDDIFWVMAGATRLYRSNGDGSFTDATNSLIAAQTGETLMGTNAWTLWSVARKARCSRQCFSNRRKGMYRCSARFVDSDGDGLLDLAITGEDGESIQRGGLFRNRGSWFEDVTNLEFDGDQVPLPRQPYGKIAWVDVDGNRSPDYAAIDQSGLQLWRNTRFFPEDESSSLSSSSSSSSSSSTSSTSSSGSSFSADSSSSTSDDDGDSDKSESSSTSFRRPTLW